MALALPQRRSCREWSSLGRSQGIVQKKPKGTFSKRGSVAVEEVQMIRMTGYRSGRFARAFLVDVFALVGLVAITAVPVQAARGPSASFEGLGQMPGVVIQPGECGTQAFGISGDGSVIVGAGCLGSSKTGTAQRAFRWTVAGGYQPLGDLGGGNSVANAASFDGSVIVGNSTDSSGNGHGFRWTAAQGMVAIPCGGEAVTDDGTMVAGGNCWSTTSGQTGNFGGGSCTDPQAPLQVFDLSANGSVAAGAGKGGLDRLGQQATNAYLSTPSGGCQDIDAVRNRNSDASGISADGQVIVGEAQDQGGAYRAFRWTAASGMEDLGTLGGGDLVSRASATNRDGSVVVGTSLITGSSNSNHAFIWTATCGMQDLDTVLKNQGARIPNGWILQFAADISEDGTVITGWGISPVAGSKFGQTGPWRAVLPVPPC